MILYNTVSVVKLAYAWAAIKFSSFRLAVGQNSDTSDVDSYDASRDLPGIEQGMPPSSEDGTLLSIAHVLWLRIVGAWRLRIPQPQVWADIQLQMS